MFDRFKTLIYLFSTECDQVDTNIEANLFIFFDDGTKIEANGFKSEVRAPTDIVLRADMLKQLEGASS